MTKTDDNRDSLFESGLSTNGNPFRTTPMVITFNALSFNPKFKTTDEQSIQSSHHFHYKSNKIIYRNAKATFDYCKAVPITQHNTANAEFIFRHKFSIRNIPNYKATINLQELFSKFNDIKIRNNEELRDFLYDTLDFGEDIQFDMNKPFTTNMRLYADFITLTTGIIMSCIEGNHRMYTAISSLMGITDRFPLNKEKDFNTNRILPENCSILKHQDMHIVTFIYRKEETFNFKSLIEKAQSMSRKYTKSMDTKINGNWDEYMRITSQKLKDLKIFTRNSDMRKHEYVKKKTDSAKNTYLLQKIEEIFTALTKTFDYMPLKANINVTETEIEDLLNYRQTAKFSIINRLPAKVSKKKQI